ncbi:hypothetical protein [Mesorhizobium sp. M0146]|uniref:hypothetical protein n=1 Tax=unclassified Mesorhizobium TaxID=325217 RepID=UPI003338A784
MTKQARLNEWTGHQWAAPRERSEQAQNLCKLTGKSQQTQVRATGSRRLSGLLGIKRTLAGNRCMSPKTAQRFWDNDMHQNKKI